MRSQLFLDFEHTSSYIQEDFIVTLPNLDAFRAIENYNNWPNKRLIILGEEGSGKTHLCRIWQELTDAIFLTEETDITDLIPYNFIIDGIQNFAEHKLFHIINYASRNGLFLLMTAPKLPNFKLADLQSRINSTSKSIIREPNEELVRVLLAKQLSDRQFKFDYDVIEYLLPRIDRSYDKIRSIVDRIDNNISSSKGRLSLKSLKNILQEDIVPL